MLKIDVVNKSDCTGCAACSAVCPRQCISMNDDDMGGFLYPKINEDKCIDCGRCAKVCQAIDFNSYNNNKVEAYIGTASEESVKESSSGGAAAEISNTFIKKGGAVYGCAWTQDLKVVHQRGITHEDIQPFRKSKYIQSSIQPCFSLIEKDLKEGLPVLFTGVSCQCAAVQKYLAAKNFNTEKLYIINLLCHGVSSQHLFDIYRKEQERKLGRNVVSYTFKNKKPIAGTVNSRSAEIVYDNGECRIVGIDQDPYLKMYYSKLAYRPSCMKCKFACPERVSDITVADAWKIDNVYGELNPLAGISLILINSEKGASLLKSTDSFSELKRISTEWALNSQQLFHEPTRAHKNREIFLRTYQQNGFEYSVWKLTRKSFLVKNKIYIKSLLNRIINFAKQS